MGGKWSKYSKIVIICQGVHFRILIGWVLEKLNDDMANNIWHYLTLSVNTWHFMKESNMAISDTTFQNQIWFEIETI